MSWRGGRQLRELCHRYYVFLPVPEHRSETAEAATFASCRNVESDSNVGVVVLDHCQVIWRHGMPFTIP